VKIAFFDPFALDYVVSTPYTQPLGGGESSLCYLAVQLAQLGHEVVLFNNTTTPGNYLGVNCVSRKCANIAQELQRFDRIVVLNVPVASRLRSAIGAASRLILWSGDAHDMPRAQNLSSADECSAWNAFVLKSSWQKRKFVERFSIPAERAVVLRNAISPHFVNLFPDAASLVADKQDPPVLAYTSTPFRGLEILLDVFPRIRALVPGVTLRIYSSMKVYQWPEGQDPYERLYERCRNMVGVEYVGSLAQPALAEALRSASVLAYPNTYAETSCISVMEAMAAGCRVVTTDLGALPETTAGHARLIGHLTNADDRDRFATDFVQATIAALNELRTDPESVRNRVYEAVRHVNESATWPIRAKEWSHFLQAL
jgi:glycosyltransferase involved in cell wall biosynthesis